MTSKRLGLLVILAVLVFAALVGYGDFRETGQRLAHFPMTHLIAALALALFLSAVRTAGVITNALGGSLLAIAVYFALARALRLEEVQQLPQLVAQQIGSRFGFSRVKSE